MSLNYEERIEKLKSQLYKLLESEPHTVRIVRNGQKDFDYSGVYIIKTLKGKIVYAGMTNDKIWKRMRDHHRLNKGSNLRHFIQNDAMRDNYLVQCLKITNEKGRHQLEHFAISILEPKYNLPKISK